MRLEKRAKIIEQRVYTIGETDPESALAKQIAERIGVDLSAGRIRIKPLPKVAVELGRLPHRATPTLVRRSRLFSGSLSWQHGA